MLGMHLEGPYFSLKQSGAQDPANITEPISKDYTRIVERFGQDPDAMKQAGIAYATDQIIDLIANGINNIHVYSNKLKRTYVRLKYLLEFLSNAVVSIPSIEP